MSSLTLLALTLVAVMVCALYALDSLALLSRIHGAASNEYAIFNHVSMVILVFNRIVTALVLPLIGFQIDMGIEAWKLSAAYFVSALLMFGIFVLLIVSSPQFLRLIGVIGNKLGWLDISVTTDRNAPLHTERSQQHGLRIKAAIAQVFFILGFCIPSMAAATFPDFRATLLQFGFVLNSLGTVINIFFVEKDVAAASRANDRTGRLADTAAAIFNGRAWASLASAVIFFILAWALQ